MARIKFNSYRVGIIYRGVKSHIICMLLWKNKNKNYLKFFWHLKFNKKNATESNQLIYYGTRNLIQLIG